MSQLFASSQPLALAMTTAALLLWFHAQNTGTAVGKKRILYVAACLAGLNAAATWIILLGFGPGLVAAVWAGSLIAPLIVLSHKTLPLSKLAWPLACIFAGGLHALSL